MNSPLSPLQITLPSLATLRALSLEEREEALEAWVSWLNANRHLVSPNFERQLDQALHDLRADTVRDSVLIDLDDRFNDWLASAGRPGVGRGPDEELEDI